MYFFFNNSMNTFVQRLFFRIWWIDKLQNYSKEWLLLPVISLSPRNGWTFFNVCRIVIVHLQLKTLKEYV